MIAYEGDYFNKIVGINEKTIFLGGFLWQKTV
jgi:hypothetical protein